MTPKNSYIEAQTPAPPMWLFLDLGPLKIN